ncbi:UNVERIFIED_CONTAM: hypothetical protein GTU68_043840 [Idotea baltica]|nr:hypothetical protein [Idotea baltica]
MSDQHELATPCSIEAAVDVIGDRWSLLILRNAFRGVRRFSEIQDDLGIAKNLLASRLRRLVEVGVLSKVPYQEHPVRYEYRLTPKGADLSATLIALMRWGDHWYAHDDPPTILVHDECLTPLELATRCPQCDVVVTPGHIRSRNHA